MDFQTSVRTCLKEKYASFSGRASMSEYWWFVLAYVLGALIFMLLGIRILYALYVLAMIVPVTAAGFRRLQDTGRPGWYMLVPVGVGLLAMLISPRPMMHGPGMGVGLLSIVLGLIQLVLLVVFIYWLTRPSQPETNEYGPPPSA